tara:strand:- start:120 stop:818 length:699 start_codon:yes stop_codon:yes gene_type:complete
MKIIFPQATQDFTQLLLQMLEKSMAQIFLDKSFEGYELERFDKIIIVVLKNKEIERFLNEYLRKHDQIRDFEIITLTKETSGAICTTLMAISSLKNQPVVISALDQIIEGTKIDFNQIIYDDDFDVVVPTFFSKDSTLCFTLKDDEGSVIQLFEKKPVSNDAVLGIYLVRNFTDFYKNCYELLIKYKGFKDRLFYTSDVINNYIGKGYKCEFPITTTKYLKIRSIQDMDNIL